MGRCEQRLRWGALVACVCVVVFMACSPEQPPLDDGGQPVGSESCNELGLDDYDGDGISDIMEGSVDTDGDLTADRRDLDSDNDGRDDAVEAGSPRTCDEEPYDSDGDGVPDYRDLDSDDNGIPDAEEDDEHADADNIPNWRDMDDDGDRIPDSVELGRDPYDAPDTDGDGIPDYHDTDSDGDGLDDAVEGANDVDHDGLGNYRDLDSDGDGISDQVEGIDDCDGDGLGAFIDTDSNGDGIPDWEPGVVHEGACPPCSPNCVTSGEVIPSPDDEGSDGVVENPDGPGIVIGSESTEAGFAWIANSEDPWPSGGGALGTVTKLDLDTGEEVARYVVGLPGQQNSPSRTAVDGNGDAYIACRAFSQQGSVVKIAADEADCVDRNGNGRIDTSTDSTPFDYGEDECILWTAEVGGIGGTPRAMTVDLGGLDAPQGMPWVGLFEEMRALMLDPDTGETLETVAMGVTPYGFALDSLGSIWSSSLGYQIQRIDSTTYEADPPITLGGGCSSTYGIATDPDDRVWIAASEACRYDPADGSWFIVSLAGAYGRGVAVDPYGVVWVAGNGGDSFIGFNADDGSDFRSYPSGGSTPVGIAVDSNGYVWAINQYSSNAARLDPITEEVETFPTGQYPYTYSDFTGFQRARVFSQGVWENEFEACAERGEHTELTWRNLVWSASTPGSTSIEFKARSAMTYEGLDTAEEVTLALVPGSSSPVSIQEAFDTAGVALGWYLRLTATLRSSGGSRSPVLEDLVVSWECDDGAIR